MWREVSFVVEREHAEPWCDALLAAGALSVQAEDADADSPDEQALFGEPGLPLPAQLGWQRTRLAALLTAAADHRAVLAAAARALGQPEPLDTLSRTFDDQDWVRLSQAQFEPIPIGQRLLITPSWRQAAASNVSTGGRVAITLDPGLAFGTGSHPTTRMCLAWLDAHLRAGSTVIDYGCGSGILAIAAARLGARRVSAIDIDPLALIATRANAAVNGVQVAVLDTDAPAPAPADLVLANILATPLKLLAPLLQSLVLPGGALVLAGLLERQVDEIAGHYRELRPTVFRSEDGWACLAAYKSA